MARRQQGLIRRKTKRRTTYRERWGALTVRQQDFIRKVWSIVMHSIVKSNGMQNVAVMLMSMLIFETKVRHTSQTRLCMYICFCIRTNRITVQQAMPMVLMIFQSRISVIPMLLSGMCAIVLSHNDILEACTEIEQQLMDYGQHNARFSYTTRWFWKALRSKFGHLLDSTSLRFWSDDFEDFCNSLKKKIASLPDGKAVVTDNRFNSVGFLDCSNFLVFYVVHIN